MEKVEIKRLIFCIILFVLSTSCAVLGIIKYYDGYGKYGKIRKELIPIIDTFNNSKLVKNSKDSIWAEYYNDSIKISYIDKNINLKYNFKYSNMNDINYLDLTYSKNESIYVEKILTELIESISLLNSNNYGDVFNKYKYSDFYTTTLLDGIKLSRNESTITIKIATNIDFIKKLDNKFNKYTTQSNYISLIELRNMIASIEEKGTFEIIKENINLYVLYENNNYYIYIKEKNNNKNNIYESIMSVIYILNNSLYDNVYNTKEKFDEETYNYYYQVIKNAEPIANIKGKNITEVIIKEGH